MGVGVRLKRILSQRNMTIKELSELSGISINTLYSITKRDSKRVDYYTIGLISRSLKINPNELLSDPYPPEIESIHKKVKMQSNRLKFALSMLNFDGKEKVIQYAEDIGKIEQYQIEKDTLEFMSSEMQQVSKDVQYIYKDSYLDEDDNQNNQD